MPLILRHHQAGDTRSEAVFSNCGLYRYRLSRDWGPSDWRQRGRLLFVMLNPSTADERANDPTVARCESRARAMGFGGVEVVNLFAFRATKPADLRRASNPVGPQNAEFLAQAAAGAAMILCAWGTHGAFLGRGEAVLAELQAKGLPLCHLGLTREGHPRHPLYIPAARMPEAFPLAPSGQTDPV